MRWPTSQQPDRDEIELRQQIVAALSDDDLDVVVALHDLADGGALPDEAEQILEPIISRVVERLNAAEAEESITNEDDSSDFASLLARHWHGANAVTREKLRKLAQALGIDAPAEPMRRLRPPAVEIPAQPRSATPLTEIAPENPAQERSRDAEKRSKRVIPADADEIEREAAPQPDPFWTTGEGAWY